MNFLAHIHLSGTDHEIIAGNFMADFVKGNKKDEFPPGIARGIDLHRHIDHFTDLHPVVGQSKRRLHAKYHHYSGVIVDMYYDHFLAHNWNDYHPKPLEQFTLEAYRIIQSFRDILPERLRFMLRYMMRDNWLFNYGKIEGLARALSGMARRTKFESNMDKAIHDLKQDYSEYENEFRTFYPELIKFSNDYLS